VHSEPCLTRATYPLSAQDSVVSSDLLHFSNGELYLRGFEDSFYIAVNKYDSVFFKEAGEARTGFMIFFFFICLFCIFPDSLSHIRKSLYEKILKFAT
jgi:hypothetical protein